MCNTPGCMGHGTSANEILRHARRTIKQHGWAVIPIIDSTPAYAYTAGLTERGWPELRLEVDDTGDVQVANNLGTFLNLLIRQLINEDTRPAAGNVVTVKYNATTAVTCYLSARLNTRSLGVARKLYSNRRTLSVLDVEIVHQT